MREKKGEKNQQREKKSHQHCEGRFDEPTQNWRKQRSKFMREMILQTESSQKIQKYMSMVYLMRAENKVHYTDKII